MKRIVFLLIIVFISTTVVFAQGRDMRRADRNLNRGNLADAKENIEAAMEYEEILEDPEIWILQARLYINIAMSEEPEYRQLAERPVNKADAAIKKAIELDTDNTYLIEIQQNMLFLSELIFNEGVDAYNQEQWGQASDYFLRAYEIGESFDAKDTTTLYNAALAAELGRDFERARDMYLDLKRMEYDQPFIYSSLSNISLFMRDTLAGTEYIREGRERYPEDLDLIFTEANIHIFTGDVESAEKVLDLAIQRDPDNPSLYFAFGANYDKMAQDTMYTVEEREFAFVEAVKAYEKALELNPDYFDAMYNLGALYFNKGLVLFERAEERIRETQDFARYEEDEKEFREIWLEAQPYLEEALTMIDEDDPSYRTVVISLVELYARTNQPEKLREIEELYLKYFGTEE